MNSAGRTLELLGYWFHDRAPDAWPLPQLLVGRWRAADRTAVLAHLRAGRPLVTYPRASQCRFSCGERRMGRRELTDGTYVWPEGLAHYVERHDVLLPRPFVAHARTCADGGGVPVFRLPRPRFGLYDPEPWKRWGRRRGACLDLDGWVRPVQGEARRIAKELGGIAAADVMLFRGETREVVVVEGGGGVGGVGGVGVGGLVVHRVQDGRHRVRRIAGWEQWPAAR